ncbi:MAG: ABC transporter ATP-binding protein [Alphaproteobacteria bacterium]
MASRRGIRLESISKTFQARERTVEALRDVTFDCSPGSFTALIGPSGCGKSTILRLALGLERADAGQIVIGDETPDEAKAKGATGVAFQDAALLPWRSVEHNIALPLDVLGRSRRQYAGKIAELINLVGLTGFEKALPGELSGGMRQRVSIARALVTQPDVLFLDEPFGALDQILRRQMNIELQRISMESGATTLLVTHGVDEAVFLADRVVVMQAGPGRITQIIDIGFQRPRAPDLFRNMEFRRLTDDVTEALQTQ